MKLTKDKLQYFIDNQHRLTERAFLIQLFGVGIELNDGECGDYNVEDTFTLTKGMISNYKYDKPVETTVGRFLANYITMVDCFGDIIPYISDSPWNIKKVQRMLARYLLNDQITTEQVKKYCKNAYFLFHFSELFMPTITEKSFEKNPALDKRRDELFEQYKDKLHDPTVMVKIEKELIQMDKDFLEGDPSKDFYDGVGSKAFNIHRKKMFITVGGIESFGDSGKWNFVKKSLSDGWDPEAFAQYANEIRKGSYNRGAETAKGGEATKVIMRVFEAAAIQEDDCKTAKGLKIIVSDKNKESYVGRHVIVGNKSILLTDLNIGQYVGKSIEIRSPMYCKTKNGLCYTCMGNIFKTLNYKNLGLLCINISSTFLSHAMKNMHGTVIEMADAFGDEFFIKPTSDDFITS
jgi:hypothetical protein